MKHTIKPEDRRYDELLSVILAKIDDDMTIRERMQIVMHPDDVTYCKYHGLSDGQLAYLEFLLWDDDPCLDAKTKTYGRSFCPDGASWYAGRAHVETKPLRHASWPDIKWLKQ